MNGERLEGGIVSYYLSLITVTKFMTNFAFYLDSSPSLKHARRRTIKIRVHTPTRHRCMHTECKGAGKQNRKSRRRERGPPIE